MQPDETDNLCVKPIAQSNVKPQHLRSEHREIALTGSTPDSLDESHHSSRQKSSKARSPIQELELKPSVHHENYHEMHYEAIERATVTEEEESSLFDLPGTRRTLPSISNNYVKRDILDMKERIRLLERRLASSANHAQEANFVNNNDSLIDYPDDVNSISGNIQDVGLVQQPILPQLCERSWSEFMNKCIGDTHEYAIEVLMEEPNYPDAKQVDKRHDKSNGLKPNSDIRKDTILSKSDAGEPSIPDRIRINSPWILKVLAEIDKDIDPTGPVVMLRPFKFLVQYENRVRDFVTDPKDDADGANSDVLPTQTTQLSTSGSSSNWIDAQGSENRLLVLQHIRCLVQFIDKYLRPTLRRLEKDLDCKIQFRDLWYIFKPGETVYMPLRHPRGPVSIDRVTTGPEMFQSRYNILWRVTGSGGGRPVTSGGQNRTQTRKSTPFRVNCYYIDFDGRYFCPTTHTFMIMPYDGERLVTSLDFYPLRFQGAAQRTLQEHIGKGRIVFNSIASSFTHFYYCGPSLLVQPCGCPIKEDAPKQEYIESEVIVDFRNTLMIKSTWRPRPTFWKAPPVDRRDLLETVTVQYWEDSGRRKLNRTEHDQIYDDYYIDEENATSFRDHEQIFAPIPSGWVSNEQWVPEKDVMLLPGRVFGFVLRDRSFAPMWLWLLQPIKPQLESLHDLQFQDDILKNRLHALVRTHFIQKTAQQATKDTTQAALKYEYEYEAVRGKGQGLVILLHGAPGVGKTFTAESIAAANGKPLFQITCGDLGLTPSEVEKSLKEIFRFAQLWSCVLLLDECDIFLTQRSKNDIKRNGLVSVFLRVLEFYTGVLFLTTNRVGVLDDAIKSRITWTLYYPPLDWKQTKGIWKANLKHLKERNQNLQVDGKGIMAFAKNHFYSCSKDTQWNGRQIQNAFKVAVGLAEWDAYGEDVQHSTDTRVPLSNPETRPTLSAAQFDTVAAGTHAFDTYLQETTGYTEADRAYTAMERADHFDPWEKSYEGNDTLSRQDDKRVRSTTFSAQETTIRQRRMSATANLAPPQSQARDPTVSPRLQPTGRRSSNQLQPQNSLSHAGQNPSHFATTRSPSRKSSIQQVTVTGAVNHHIQSVSKRKLSHPGTYHDSNTAITISSPPDSAARAKRHQHRHSTGSAPAWQEPSPNVEDGDASSSFDSTDDDFENRHDFGDPASDQEGGDEFLDELDDATPLSTHQSAPAYTAKHSNVEGKPW